VVRVDNCNRSFHVSANLVPRQHILKINCMRYFSVYNHTIKRVHYRDERVIRDKTYYIVFGMLVNGGSVSRHVRKPRDSHTLLMFVSLLRNDVLNVT
jgi:hypothetical protein